MHIQLLTVQLQLPGCSSLKEKRSRTRCIRDKFKQLANVAVLESGLQDKHQSSEWSFVIVGLDKKLISQTQQAIETFLSTEMDAVVTDIQSERL